jgi:aspartate beta-hydroxylase
LQLKKLHDEASWSKKRRILTWLVIIIVLLGLTYYYYNKYQPTGTAAKGRNVEEKSQPLKSTTKTAPKNNNKSSNKKSTSGKNPPKTSSPSANSKKKTESEKPTKTSPPAGTNKYHPSSKITDLPILRRPVPPSDPDRPLIIEILAADDSLEVKAYDIAVEKFDAILNRFPQSPRGLLGKAMALEGAGMKSTKPKFKLDKAIDLYYQVGFDSFLASEDLKLHALIRLAKCADLRSKHTLTVKALEFAAKLEPENPTLLTRLGQAYIKANKLTKAKTTLDNVITKWPNNTLALASIGYLLYREDNCTGALQLFLIGLSENEEVRQDGRFYIYAGECMTKLNKTDEAKMLYNEGVQRGLFPSVDQRSVYNENGLDAKPWWGLSETKESILLKFEEKTDAIKHEIALAINNGLMEDHSMTLYSKGTQNPKGCQAVPETCNILSKMTSAETCKRGEVSEFKPLL